MQIQQSIASLIGGPIDNLGTNFDAPPPQQTGCKHGDRIGRSPFPQWPSTTGTANGFNAILAQLMSLLQQLLATFGQSAQSQNPQPQSGQPVKYPDPINVAPPSGDSLGRT
jgi:hypothetical protein